MGDAFSDIYTFTAYENEMGELFLAEWLFDMGHTFPLFSPEEDLLAVCDRISDVSFVVSLLADAPVEDILVHQRLLQYCAKRLTGASEVRSIPFSN